MWHPALVRALGNLQDKVKKEKEKPSRLYLKEQEMALMPGIEG